MSFENLAEKHPNLAERPLSLVENPQDLAEKATRGACSAWALWLLPRPGVHRNIKVSLAENPTILAEKHMDLAEKRRNLVEAWSGLAQNIRAE